MSIPLEQKRDRLLELLRSFGSCAVAFSGGVDSSVVAKGASDALRDCAVAVTGVSASLAAGELESARQLAVQIGIRHELVQTDEFADANYTANPANRCYYCKMELYACLEPLAKRLGLAVIVNGANLDDAGDWRPGKIAATEHRVRSPLAECRFTKGDVRALAAMWNLSVRDKPASPCLSSRVAYGEEVTPARLAMIDRAEQVLRELGLQTVRARYHRGDLARLEVPVEAISLLASPAKRASLVMELKRLGFKYITLDLEGFRSGSQNAAIEGSTFDPLLPVVER
jgi:pyridinium-3,5-biscarboxylic acid mononucleotide sulfurtransferase